MPLFSTRRTTSPERMTAPAVEPDRKHGIFHRNKSPTGTESSTSTHSRTSSASSGRHKGGFLHKAIGRDDGVDPGILQARERVMDAEDAEAQADRALEQARLRVREAREHMKRVELEAKEEARRAKIKQAHARDITKRGKGLGRHGI
ncbi:hypothetical protein AAL_07667 [Moelleriella libera RCEF 2490]|uniref:Uncharacterized protein n=1 Tax=Moelleriella libera RCEF 2490 TaxID=1081109 RepID=A0A167WWY2_9HYPO|nr:hypothetical protein AAL_07667 [Moelleriella libera RCEF 2490]